MPDTITDARLKRIIDQLQELERALQAEQDLHPSTAALRTLTGLALDLARSVRTIAQRNP